MNRSYWDGNFDDWAWSVLTNHLPYLSCCYICCTPVQEKGEKEMPKASPVSVEFSFQRIF